MFVGKINLPWENSWRKGVKVCWWGDWWRGEGSNPNAQENYTWRWKQEACCWKLFCNTWRIWLELHAKVMLILSRNRLYLTTKWRRSEQATTTLFAFFSVRVHNMKQSYRWGGLAITHPIAPSNRYRFPPISDQIYTKFNSNTAGISDIIGNGHDMFGLCSFHLHAIPGCLSFLESEMEL